MCVEYSCRTNLNVPVGPSHQLASFKLENEVVVGFGADEQQVLGLTLHTERTGGDVNAVKWTKTQDPGLTNESSAWCTYAYSRRSV
jgi:hypothetical protein